MALRRGDLDWMGHSALVKGKGSKYRKVYLDERAWMALKTYLQARQDGGDARALARIPAFCGHGNRSGRVPSPLTTRHVSRTIQALARKAGIAQVGVTPHYFRHVFATRALERTENLALVQDMLGHASPATTRVYAKTNEKQRREGYARVWEEMEHNVDALAGRGAHFEAAVSILKAVRLGDDKEEAPELLLRVALAEFLWSSGCSLEDAVKARVSDLDLGECVVSVPADGGLHPYPFGDQARVSLVAYLRARDEADSDMLFCGPEGSPLSVEDALSILRAAAEEAGVRQERVYPDLFHDVFLAVATDVIDSPEMMQAMWGADWGAAEEAVQVEMAAAV